MIIEDVYNIIYKYTNLNVKYSDIKLFSQLYFEDNYYRNISNKNIAFTIKINNEIVIVINMEKFKILNDETKKFIVIHELVHAFSYRKYKFKDISGIESAYYNSKEFEKLNEAYTNIISRYIYYELYKKPYNERKNNYEIYLKKILRKYSQKKIFKIYFYESPLYFFRLCCQRLKIFSYNQLSKKLKILE